MAKEEPKVEEKVNNSGLHPMAQSDLKAITSAPTAVDSFIAVVAWLKGNQTISADVAGIVTAGLKHHRDALEPAIVANVHN